MAATYLGQGIEHILFGFDHLLFVAALLLIIGDWRVLVKTITAFTVAHSITLTLATLGLVTLPSGPVEALIALSDPARRRRERFGCARGETSLAISRPWVVAFAFGLLHGFGFAGALRRTRLAAGRHPARAVLVQRRRRGRATDLCRSDPARVPRHSSALRHAEAGIRRRRLRDRDHRLVLGDRTGGGDLSVTAIEAVTITSETKTSRLGLTANQIERTGGPMNAHVAFTCFFPLTAAALAAVAGFRAGQRRHRRRHPRQATAERLYPAKRPYSPWAGRNFPTRPLFGDTHLHTSFSMDAGAFGARLGPRDAYRFAKGEEITASSGQLAKLSRPLDFLVVADHSDNMGFFPDLLAGKPEILADPQGRRWYDMIQSGQGAAAAIEIITAFGAGKLKGPLLYSPELRALSLGVGGDHRRGGGGERPRPLHRLHRLRVDVEHRRQQPPPQRHLPRRRASSRARSCPSPTLPPGSDNPRDLWKWMAAYEEKTGGDVLAIAHNGNLSNGRMFPMIELVHRPADRPRIRRDPRQVGAALRGDADQGRRRDPSLPVAERRVRQFRALGQGQPRPDRGQDAGDARVRVCALGAEERPEARGGARASIPTSSA